MLKCHKHFECFGLWQENRFDELIKHTVWRSDSVKVFYFLRLKRQKRVVSYALALLQSSV